jgi:HAE1 family hydrophobic/amphiphilic exporter-1
VIVIPGLYYLFASLSARSRLLPDEDELPLSEVPERE